MAGEKINITSPVARIVSGSLYKPNDKNFDGQPLVYKNGADAGKPRVQYFFAIAIPKKPGETHWASTEWGSKIWAVGHKEFPQAALRPDFSWKIEDGDSQIPNKRNRKPCDQEGWPGHWIVKLSSSFAPSIYRYENGAWLTLTQPDLVKCGYFVQVGFSVDGNNQQGNPGVYLNPGAVAFIDYGAEINFGPNVEDYGFSTQAPTMPLAPASTMPAGAPPAPGSPYPPPPAAAAPYPPAPPSVAAAAPPPVPVSPNPQFLQVPPPVPGATAGPGGGTAGYASSAAVVSAHPPAPPAPATTQSPSSRRMLPAAGNVSYEAYIKAGWNDAQLIQSGYMIVG
jgi:hypothetical protein